MTLKRKKSRIGSRMGYEWFRNQNVDAYYTFLGVFYFHECIHRWGKHSPSSPIK